jgi:methylphosphotriester-DNA--protein-cysteine methyltransferase
MKSFLTVLLFSAVALFATGASSVATYVGSKNSNVYHLPSCRYVTKITKEHLITFETKDEAQKKGYRPCKVCKP